MRRRKGLRNIRSSVESQPFTPYAAVSHSRTEFIIPVRPNRGLPLFSMSKNPGIVRYTFDGLPPLTEAQKEELAALAAQPDESIDSTVINPNLNLCPSRT